MHRKEKKMRENHGKKGIIYAENLVKALLCAYLVTGMVLLLLISFGMYREVSSGTGDLFLTFVLCTGGGMLGGMVS